MWYNEEHRHSKLNFVTPSERHKGKDKDILSARKQVLESAKRAHPLRWSGEVRNCKVVGAVTLNPDEPPEKEIPKKQVLNKAA